MPVMVAKQKVADKAFARKYVENGMNGTKTMKELRPHINSHSARVAAAQTLAKTSTQDAIIDVLRDKGMTDEWITEQHKNVVAQQENYSAKNTGIELYHKLKGRLKNETQHNHVHLHADLKEVEEKLAAIDSELAELKE